MARPRSSLQTFTVTPSPHDGALFHCSLLLLLQLNTVLPFVALRHADIGLRIALCVNEG